MNYFKFSLEQLYIKIDGQLEILEDFELGNQIKGFRAIGKVFDDFIIQAFFTTYKGWNSSQGFSLDHAIGCKLAADLIGCTCKMKEVKSQEEMQRVITHLREFQGRIEEILGKEIKHDFTLEGFN